MVMHHVSKLKSSQSGFIIMARSSALYCPSYVEDLQQESAPEKSAGTARSSRIMEQNVKEMFLHVVESRPESVSRVLRPSISTVVLIKCSVSVTLNVTFLTSPF